MVATIDDSSSEEDLLIPCLQTMRRRSPNLRYMTMRVISLVVAILWITRSVTLADSSQDVGGGCHRWNCPCAGQTPSPQPFSRPGKRQHPHEGIYQSARRTRQKTRDLLNRITRERFRNNEDHIQSLEECVTNRTQRCLGLHLDRCRLEGFPSQAQVQSLRRSEIEIERFMRDAQRLLSSLAVYVEQARMDENSQVTDRDRSFSQDIERIEESGIYHILCSLQISANYRAIPWDASVARGVMLLGCRSFDGEAPVDNRNYMVFYILEKILDKIAHPSAQKRGEPLLEGDDTQEHSEIQRKHHWRDKKVPADYWSDDY